MTCIKIKGTTMKKCVIIFIVAAAITVFHACGVFYHLYTSYVYAYQVTDRMFLNQCHDSIQVVFKAKETITVNNQKE